jgi:hypothetical protein
MVMQRQNLDVPSTKDLRKRKAENEEDRRTKNS